MNSFRKKLKVDILIVITIIMLSASFVFADTATVNCGHLNLRQNSTTKSKVLTFLKKGDSVDIIAKRGRWYNVSSNGIQGWVYGRYVSIPRAVPVAQNVAILTSRGDNTTQTSDIAEYAKQLLGSRYVYGGTTPKGFDCSGFVMHVYSKFGIELNRTVQGIYSQGSKVAKANLKPGDVIFFDTNRDGIVNHMGIYAGNGEVIHASSTKRRISIEALSMPYYQRTYVAAKRFF